MDNVWEAALKDFDWGCDLTKPISTPMHTTKDDAAGRKLQSKSSNSTVSTKSSMSTISSASSKEAKSAKKVQEEDKPKDPIIVEKPILIGYPTAAKQLRAEREAAKKAREAAKEAKEALAVEENQSRVIEYPSVSKQLKAAKKAAAKKAREEAESQEVSIEGNEKEVPVQDKNVEESSKRCEPTLTSKEKFLGSSLYGKDNRDPKRELRRLMGLSPTRANRYTKSQRST